MRFRGVFLVVLMLSLIFTSVTLGMVIYLTNCTYQPYYMEMTKACDKIYSYNSVRFWSAVYLPHDVIVFTLAEGALLGVVFSSRKRQPLLLHSIAFLAVGLSTGMQIHGLTRHGKPSEDYTNFSEGYAAFCFLSFVCMALVELALVSDDAYTSTDESDTNEPIPVAAPVMAGQSQQQEAPATATGTTARPTLVAGATASSAEPPPYSQ